jgi:NADH dehydrogenase
LLYQVATGGLSPGDIAAALRWVLRRQANARVLLGEVTAVDAAQRLVRLGDGDAVPFDTLVVATGAANHYFGRSEWAPLAPALKTVEDATEIRSRILAAFERAERAVEPAQRHGALTFLVVGAGPTGVELAGAIGELAGHTLRREFRAFDPRAARVLMVEGGPRVLPTFPERLSRAAARSLARLGVEVLTDAFVTEIRPGAVRVRASQGETTIPADTVLWAAGVRASPLGAVLAATTGADLDRSGRVMVGPDLAVPGHADVFVIGDLAHVLDEAGNPLPGLAPVAMQQGRYVAKRIRRRLAGRDLPAFRYHNKGQLATIGRAAAVADLGWLRFSGFPAWALWLFLHLMYLVGFENRLLVFTQWAWNYFTWNRGTRLIAHAEKTLGG